MNQPLIIVAKDQETGALFRYPMPSQHGYAFHMTSGKLWIHVITVDTFLEIYDAHLPSSAEAMKEKWRIVRVSDGKVLRTNIIPPPPPEWELDKVSPMYDRRRSEVPSPWVD